MLRSTRVDVYASCESSIEAMSTRLKITTVETTHTLTEGGKTPMNTYQRVFDEVKIDGILACVACTMHDL